VTNALTADEDAGRRFSDGVSLPDLVRYLREGVYIMGADGVLLDANPVALDLLGVTSLDAAPRRPIHDRARTPAQWRSELDALVRDGAIREFTREIEQPDGTTRTLLDTCYARVDGERVTFHGIVIDVSVVATRDSVAPRDAHPRDPETGAYTADYLDLLDTAHDTEADGALGVCVLSVDPMTPGDPGFPVSDQRLERMTRFILRHIRASEFVVRAAPEQLVIVLPNADERATEIVGRRLQLAALRSAPAPFRLGWAARRSGEPVRATVGRAVQEAVPVRVVERTFDPSRQR
jgi:GGDEF domain-containing protein